MAEYLRGIVSNVLAFASKTQATEVDIWIKFPVSIIVKAQDSFCEFRMVLLEVRIGFNLHSWMLESLGTG